MYVTVLTWMAVSYLIPFGFAHLTGGFSAPVFICPFCMGISFRHNACLYFCFNILCFKSVVLGGQGFRQVVGWGGVLFSVF